MSCVCVTYNGYKECAYPKQHAPQPAQEKRIVHAKQANGSTFCGASIPADEWTAEYWSQVTCPGCERKRP